MGTGVGDHHDSKHKLCQVIEQEVVIPLICQAHQVSPDVVDPPLLPFLIHKEVADVCCLVPVELLDQRLLTGSGS